MNEKGSAFEAATLDVLRDNRGRPYFHEAVPGGFDTLKKDHPHWTIQTVIDSYASSARRKRGSHDERHEENRPTSMRVVRAKDQHEAASSGAAPRAVLLR